MWLEIVQSSPYFKNMWCYAHTHKEKRLQLVACNSTSAPVTLRCEGPICISYKCQYATQPLMHTYGHISVLHKY